jgi:bifunctional DNA-binding transcriptional regulator/antitoxin component of YhaV-PrlF toxin-antitoxin module
VSATVIGEQRQATIPEDVSEAAGLRPGDQVDWRYEAGEIRGRKLLQEPSEILELDDLDANTLLPRVGQIEVKSLLKSLQSGRDRS